LFEKYYLCSRKFLGKTASEICKETVQRGQASPILLLKMMIDKAHIHEIATRGLEGTDKYVVNVQVKSGNFITIVIDGDTPVLIDDCIRLHKMVESSLDRDAEDFDLRVTSFGADKPLKLIRQYKKNIGRQLEVTDNENHKVTGKLIEVSDNEVLLEVKPVKKKQESAQSLAVAIENIAEAKVVLSFK
jgi:ribosome maturation factor RimP